MREPFDMLCRVNVDIPMRDGTILRGDLYRPAETGQYPVLLMRTVFRKEYISRAFAQYDPTFYVRHGYAVMIQDVRGLGESDGEFYRFTADGLDGYDTIERLAAQTWCDGNVGMFGNYFAGNLQLMAALERPPHLKAICPMQTSATINRSCDNRGFLFASHIGWCMSRQVNRLMDGRYDAELTERWLPKLQGWIRDYLVSQLSVAPLCDMPVLQDTPFPLFKAYDKHLLEGYDDFALLHHEGRDRDIGDTDVPALYIAGWYDSARTPIITHCMQQRSHGVDSRVLIVPWRPGESPARADSALEDGVNVIDVQTEMLNWFEAWLKGHELPKTPPVRYFDIVSGQARTGDTWPIEHDELKFYLGESLCLLPTAPRADTADAYLHDPHNPLPYRPYGACKLPDAREARSITYISEPTESDKAICGAAYAYLSIDADTPDADVMVDLIDLSPDGSAFIFCDGATRARYRQDWVSRPLEQGKVYGLRILLGDVAYTLRKGHRLGMLISGSGFPVYDVNHCTANRPRDDAEMRIAHISVHALGAEEPSCIVLPIR